MGKSAHERKMNVVYVIGGPWQDVVEDGMVSQVCAAVRTEDEG